VEAVLGSSPVWAHFTNPVASGGTDPTILTEFQRLVTNAPPGAAIRCAIHKITLLGPADALVDARARGVDVRVVVDGNVSQSTRAGALRLRELADGVRFCTGNPAGGCVTTNVGNMHAKFLILSQTTDPNGQDRRNVCWFGSPNLTSHTGRETFNNTITVYEDAALYRGFAAYFEELWNQNHYPSNDFYEPAARRGYYRAATGTIFASPAQNIDLVRARLNDVRPSASCRIRVAEARFSDGRRALADLLARHKRRGCRVWVAVGMTAAGGGQIGTAVRRTLVDAGIPIRAQRIHDKFVVVAADYRPGFQHRVYTGSHNWTHAANYDNDEIFVRMATESADSHPLYDAFRAHFIDAYDTGSSV
jgi:phosphatidylserine/phosphatidylglycerophosphate/cardiolipin synthase-like enzyme